MTGRLPTRITPLGISGWEILSLPATTNDIDAPTVNASVELAFSEVWTVEPHHTQLLISYLNTTEYYVMQPNVSSG